MLIGKQYDGSINENESWDVNITEDEFLSKGGIDRSLKPYEIVGQEEATLSHIVKNEE